MPKATKKSNAITIDVEPISTVAHSTIGTELAEIVKTSLVVFNDQDFNDLAYSVRLAENRVEQVEELYKPVSDAIKLAKKTLDTATKTLTSGANAFIEAAKGVCKEYLKDNPDASVDGELRNGQWQLKVIDEDKLFLACVNATLVDGKIQLSVNPTTRNLFQYSKSNGNTLASAMTTHLRLEGAVAEQGKSLYLTKEQFATK